MSKRPPLSGSARDSLLRRVDQLRSREAEDSNSLRLSGVHERLQLTDFSTLPGYDELRLHEAIGERLGIANPYFRLHDANAGASTRIDGRVVLNFSSYDYLGLNGHPAIHEAAKRAIDLYGISASASRCVAGQRPAHLSLESRLAEHYGVQDAMVLVSGWATNLGVIGQLLGPKDLLVLDAAIHNSVVTGGVLSGANRRSFAHNDLDMLDELLTRERHGFERALIVVEGLYSMDGDYPDLRRLVDIKNRHASWLMVDEAHALGVLGKRGFGLAEHFGVDGSNVDIWMGTLSKALVAAGGYIAGSRELIHYLKSTVGAFVYSVAIPPVIAAAAEKALELLHAEPQRPARLHSNAALFTRLAQQRGLDIGAAAATAVVPVLVGDSLLAVLLSNRLLEHGINVMPVLYPAVPANTSRLRFFVSAAHSESEIESAVETTAQVLAEVTKEAREIRSPSSGVQWAAD